MRLAAGGGITMPDAELATSAALEALVASHPRPVFAPARHFRNVAAALESHGVALRLALPVFRGASAVDPRVALFLATEFGEMLEVDGDDLYLRIRPDRRDDPVVRVFLRDGDDALKLS